MYEKPNFFTKVDVCYNNVYFQKEKIDNLILSYKKNRDDVFDIISGCVSKSNNKKKKVLMFHEVLPINEIVNICDVIFRNDGLLQEYIILLIVQIFRNCNIEFLCESIYGNDVDKCIKLKFGMLKAIKNNKNLKYPLLNNYLTSISMKRTSMNIKTHESCTYSKTFSFLFVILCDYYINNDLFTIIEG